MNKPIFKISKNISWTAHSALKTELSKAFITKNIFYVLSTDVKNHGLRLCASRYLRFYF